MCSTKAAHMAKTKNSENRTASNKVNLTINIDRDLLRKIRVIAAEEGTSISALVADIITEKSTKSGRYEEAKRRALALMEKGIPSEGPMLTRGQMHERR